LYFNNIINTTVDGVIVHTDYFVTFFVITDSCSFFHKVPCFFNRNNSCQFEKSLVDWMTMMFLLQKTDYRQISELRLGLEMQSALLAADHISDSVLDNLEELVARLGQSDDEAQSTALDKELHYTILTASGNQLMIEIWQALSEVMDLFISDLRLAIDSAPANPPGTLQSVHVAMVKALRNRDKAAISHAYQQHFNLISDSLPA